MSFAHCVTIMERSLAGAIPAQDPPTPLPSVMSFENHRQSATLVRAFSVLVESQEWTLHAI